MCPRNAVRDGHSVLLVGFRDDPAQPGGGVFLIRNTAGKSRDGLMTYEYVRTYMNDAVWVDSRRGAKGASPDGPPPRSILRELAQTTALRGRRPIYSSAIRSAP